MAKKKSLTVKILKLGVKGVKRAHNQHAYGRCSVAKGFCVAHNQRHSKCKRMKRG